MSLKNVRIKKGRTTKQIGDGLENLIASKLGGKKVTQSGGGNFFKSDVAGAASFLYECKATDGTGFRITPGLLRGAFLAASGSRGRGDSARPAVAVEVAGEAFVVVRLEDWVDVLTQPPSERAIKPSKYDERRHSASKSYLE